MSENDAIERIKRIDMPEYYKSYYEKLALGTYKAYEMAAEAKSSLADSSSSVEPKIAFDLADRVAKMHDIDIAEPLRVLLMDNSKEKSALILSKEIALGKYQQDEAGLEDRLDLAVRVGLAIVTEGVTIAPLQGIHKVSIRKNRDNSEYLSISIAGPMRSAGGTESAVTMLIADHVRKAAGLGAYQANSFGDDEVGRFIEELRIYEREAGNFQFHVQDEDIASVISHLPVEIDGPDTDPYEVVNHRDMKRIETDRVRGGALRVINDGLIGRSKKLLKRIEEYKMDGWDWLKDLKGAVHTGDEDDSGSKRLKEVITGRSVLSMPNRPGGFRLRYGRACNTGFASIGFHPAVLELLDYTITAGTQVKTDIPGKGATVALVDSIETPIVMLRGGDVVKVRDAAHASQIKAGVERILYLGDVLISLGDFLENNAPLVPTGYVPEYWDAELAAAAAGRPDLLRHAGTAPSLADAVAVSRELGLPLHPQHLYFWDCLGRADLESLLGPKEAGPKRAVLGAGAKAALEKLGAPHAVDGDDLVLEGDAAGILHCLLYENPLPATGPKDVLEAVSAASGIRLRPKMSASVGIRVGRPEKAAPRHMKPPIHCLFPIGETGYSDRDIIRASGTDDFYADISNRFCPKCQEAAVEIRCLQCDSRTQMRNYCPGCKTDVEGPECMRCKKPPMSHSHQAFSLKKRLHLAQERTRLRARPPLKGVVQLVNQNSIAEPLEKGIIRQHYGLTVFRDGTVRFDATNSPLTHFKPSWIGADISRLRELGYERDMDGAELTSPDQTVEIMMQDVILPETAAAHLMGACKYVDTELEKVYGKGPFYGVSCPDDLLGHLVVGLAPHTSVGVVARIIGFADTHGCFGTPHWHSAKRRDADGDADSVMLLMDALLNFSRNFLSDRIGGIMDAPLLIEPLVLPHESQPQAHNLEVVRSFPLKFFEDTLRGCKAHEAGYVETVKSRLETPKQFYGYDFTHSTSALASPHARSAYATLDSMLDKLDMQLKNARLIDAVEPAEIVSDLISTHLVPDIMGNLRAFARQEVRCTRCKKKYRRYPLSGKCVCGHDLIATITRPGIEKYLPMARRLVAEHAVGAYQKGRIGALSDEVELVFGKSAGQQALLSDFDG